jgi:sugar/nucleoside kinase (ribokinase family)
MGPVVTVGDRMIDAVETPGEPPQLHPGGAGLNLAVGIARPGLNGCRRMRHLRDENARLLNTPNVDFTGAAIAR